MNLDKSIKHKKAKRKQYCGLKLVDSTCRNQGSCPHCKSSRMFSIRKRECSFDDREDDYTIDS